MTVSGYRIAFFSADLGEPPHVHVTQAGAERKVWLGTREIAPMRFRDHGLREILGLLREHPTRIMQAWHE